MAFPKSALVYFQFVFAAITPILALGSVLGRVNFKAWIPFCLLWITCVYAVDAFLIWGGGFFAQHGAVDYSGGYVIHLSAGVAGFVAAAVIGPRLQRDREIDAPNNVAMVAVGAGLLWLGWNGFNGGDPYAANMSAAAAVLNTNLCTAVAFLVWVGWDYLTGRKPSLLGGVNGMHHRPGGDHPGGRLRQRLGRDRDGDHRLLARVLRAELPEPAAPVPQRRRHARRDLHARVRRSGRRPAGRRLRRPEHGAGLQDRRRTALIGTGGVAGLVHGNVNLLKWQFLAALWVICWTAVVTFVLLKLVGVFVPLRMSEKNMEIGDVAEHGHEVYPSDVPVARVPGRDPRPRPGRRRRARSGAGAVGGLAGACAPARGGLARRRCASGRTVAVAGQIGDPTIPRAGRIRMTGRGINPLRHGPGGL